MRILLVAESLNGNSGWGRYSAEMATGLTARGHDVHALVHTHSDEVDIPQHAVLPAPLSCLGNPVRPLQVASALSKAIRTIKPDIIHFTVEPYATCMAVMGALPPVVLTVHGTYAAFPLKHGIITPWFARRYLERVNSIVSVSRFTADILLETAGAEMRTKLEPKITVIHNGVRMPAETSVRGAPDGPFRILFVAALLKERKGLLEAVKACAEFKQRSGKDFIFTVIGRYEEHDPYIARIRSVIAEADMEKQVLLRGRVSEEELRAAYAEADLFMLLSHRHGLHFEGFGLVFLEANARGIPVIGPDTGGCPEAIKEGVSGYICPPSDTSAIAGRMADILIGKTIRREGCLQWAQDHEIGKTAASLEKTYTSLLS